MLLIIMSNRVEFWKQNWLVLGEAATFWFGATCCLIFLPHFVGNVGKLAHATSKSNDVQRYSLSARGSMCNHRLLVGCMIKKMGYARFHAMSKKIYNHRAKI